MNFTEVVNEILTRTKRPDKLADIRREVNSAVSIFCADVEAAEDLVESTQAIVSTEYSQALALSLFPRWRKFLYMKYAGSRRYILKLDTKKMFTSDCKMADRYYVVGTNVNINLGTLASNLDIGYYAYPPTLTDATPNHWLLDRAWNCVFDRAVAKIYADIGDAPSADRHERYATIAWLTHRADIVKESGR